MRVIVLLIYFVYNKGIRDLLQPRNKDTSKFILLHAELDTSVYYLVLAFVS